jgi:hypothetical protein
VLDLLLRALADVGPAATWIVAFIAAIVAVFVMYVGITIWATLRASDPEQQQIRYQLFSDLLDLFRHRSRQ